MRRLLDGRNSLAETRSEIAFDLIALYKALGGGWEIGDIKPIVPEAMQAQMMNRTDWGNLLPAPKARVNRPGFAGGCFV